ncbi:MAG: Stk1 family PASTA domain-containing Ser/Thr kinase [Herpetosiphon sp.]
MGALCSRSGAEHTVFCRPISEREQAVSGGNTNQNPDAANMQSRILNNRYELLGPLGNGGMATVYRGRDQRLGRPVAVKLLHPQYATDTQFLQRFEHEAQAAAGLSAHPNIVDVYDVGQDNGVPYIVMELINGRDLATVIEQEGPLAVGRSISIAEQIANGLDYAHQRGFVHRDVKPQNIMVGQNDEIKITDFGIAKSSLSTAVTQMGMTFGTADYISPEQAQGLRAIPQSDIYSLGVVVYEMLTRHLPFTGDTPMAVALQQIQQPPPPLTQWNPSLPPQLERIVLSALAKDSHDRPASAGAFAQMLREYRSSRAMETRVAPVPVVVPVLPATAPKRATAAAVPVPRPAAPRRAAAVPPPLPRSARSVAPRSPFPWGGLLLALFLLGGLLGLAYVAFFTDTVQSLFSAVAPTPLPLAPTAAPAPTAGPTVTNQVLVQITDFVGRDAKKVQDALQGAGLVADMPDPPRADPAFPAGTVVEQRPAPGSLIPKGGKVYLRLSLGPPTPAPTVPAPTVPVPTVVTLQLPNLVGQPIDLIAGSLINSGFRVSRSDQPNQSVPPGQIIGQNPAPGTYPPNTTVTLTVSAGDVVQFPPVIGTNVNAATAAIKATRDLQVDAIDLQGPDRLPNFNQIQPNSVVSATANGQPVQNGALIPRTSRIVLGVRRP